LAAYELEWRLPFYEAKLKAEAAACPTEALKVALRYMRRQSRLATSHEDARRARAILRELAEILGISYGRIKRPL
jgi:hypothetical protein